MVEHFEDESHYFSLQYALACSAMNNPHNSKVISQFHTTLPLAIEMARLEHSFLTNFHPERLPLPEFLPPSILLTTLFVACPRF